MKSLHVTKRGQFAFFFIVLSLLIVIPDCRADDGFMKDASSNCAVFKPNFRIGETVVWKGQCQHGFAQGAGVAKWTAYDGTTVMFEGTFMEGKLQGKGKMTASGGDRYDGDYKDGKREGHGVYLSANGERYEGEYKDNQRIGRGVLLRRCLQECLRDFRQVFAHNAQVVPYVPGDLKPAKPFKEVTCDKNGNALKGAEDGVVPDLIDYGGCVVYVSDSTGSAWKVMYGESKKVTRVFKLTAQRKWELWVEWDPTDRSFPVKRQAPEAKDYAQQFELRR